MKIDWYIEYNSEISFNRKRVEEESELLMSKVIEMLNDMDVNGFSSINEYIEKYINRNLSVFRIEFVNNEPVISYNKYINIKFTNSIKQIHRSLIIEKILN